MDLVCNSVGGTASFYNLIQVLQLFSPPPPPPPGPLPWICHCLNIQITIQLATEHFETLSIFRTFWKKDKED